MIMTVDKARQLLDIQVSFEFWRLLRSQFDADDSCRRPAGAWNSGSGRAH